MAKSKKRVKTKTRKSKNKKIKTKITKTKSSKKNLKTKKPIIVAVSGGFDPIHAGHIRYIREAAKLGNKLVVILNNDNWLALKKGYAFMPVQERKEVLENIKDVDEVVVTSHEPGTTDYSVCTTLKEVKPDIFANGGDRTSDNIPEVAVCKEIGTTMVFNIGQGGKMQSSSWLLKNFSESLDGMCSCGSMKKYDLCHGKK